MYQTYFSKDLERRCQLVYSVIGENEKQFTPIKEGGFYDELYECSPSCLPYISYNILFSSGPKKANKARLRWRSKRANHGRKPCHGKKR